MGSFYETEYNSLAGWSHGFMLILILAGNLILCFCYLTTTVSDKFEELKFELEQNIGI